MRLLDSKTLQLKEFPDNAIPSYAILSHTWGSDEVSYTDKMELDYVPSKAYVGDRRARPRSPIDLQSQRREEPSFRYQEYFLPGEDIHREVIQYDICRYLGNDATVRPYQHADVGFQLLYELNHPYSD